MARGMGLFVLASFALVALAAAPTLKLAELPKPADLASQLWARSPELQLARSRVAQARADAVRANLLPNPALDISANTLPIGQSNPANLDNPLANVPNYQFAISTLIELGKRGPRQESTRQAALAAAYDALEQLRQRYHELEEHIGEIAAAEVRIDALRQLAEDAAHLTTIQRNRMEKGDAAAIDSDRAQLEEDTYLANLSEAEEALITELRLCSTLSGSECQQFGDVALAQQWLSRPMPDGSSASVEDRPDLKSLQAAVASARAAEKLADRSAIPDPTLRVGYVRDQFLISGNQQNSLFVGLSIPLPLFNHGQAESQAAAVTADAADRARAMTLNQAQVELNRIDDQAKSLAARSALLKGRALPLAKDVVQRLDAAVTRGGAGFQDLILARRTLGELLINATELDLATYRLAVSRARATGTLPLPSDITTSAAP